jgi:hypothetical protein
MYPFKCWQSAGYPGWGFSQYSLIAADKYESEQHSQYSDWTLGCTVGLSFCQGWTGFGVYPASYPVAPGAVFMRIKQPRSDTDYSFPYSAELKNAWHYVHMSQSSWTESAMKYSLAFFICHSSPQSSLLVSSSNGPSTSATALSTAETDFFELCVGQLWIACEFSSERTAVWLLGC